MNDQHLSVDDPKIQAALEELKRSIRERHPEATFRVTFRDEFSVFLHTAVDLPDPYELLDALGDQLYELQVERELPIHILPKALHEQTPPSGPALRTEEETLRELCAIQRESVDRRLRAIREHVFD